MVLEGTLLNFQCHSFWSEQYVIIIYARMNFRNQILHRQTTMITTTRQFNHYTTQQNVCKTQGVNSLGYVDTNINNSCYFKILCFLDIWCNNLLFR